MKSFDIQSLFTNIPLDENINICVDLVFHKNNLKTYLNQIRNIDMHFLLVYIALFSIMFIINRLMV